MGGPDVLTALVEAVIIVALCGDGMGMGWDGMGGPDILAALIEAVIISGHLWGWDGWP